MPTEKTRTELKNLALTKLSVIGSGQSAEADDMATVEALVDPLIEQLSIDGVCEVADTDAIPAAWFNALGELLANYAATSFSQPYSRDRKLIFEAELRKLNAGQPTYEVTRMEYF